MMRTAQILKWFSYVITLLGIVAAFKYFSPASSSFVLSIVGSVLLGIILRLFSIIGQLVYEMRNDTARVLNGLERSLFQSNALLQEIRDLLDSREGGKAK